MAKQPLIPISEKSLDVRYESPSVMIVNKPKGIKVYPDHEKDSDSLLNRLFQDNRWLADMETSLTAGGIHQFEQQDHGLMVFNKTEDYTETIQAALSEQGIIFSYVVNVLDSAGSTPASISDNLHLKVEEKQRHAGYTTYFMETTKGNTAELRQLLFPDLEKEAISFFCYAINLTLPHSGEKHTTSLRTANEEIPKISVYHAPP